MKKILQIILSTAPFLGFAQTTSFLFSTAGNQQGWDKVQASANIAADGNALVLTPPTTTGMGNNFMDISNLTNTVNADLYKGVTVKLKNTTVSTDLRFRITVNSVTQFVKATISTGDSTYQTYYFDLNYVAPGGTSNPWENWNGTVTGQNLRLTKAQADVWSNSTSAAYDEITFTPTATLSTIDITKGITDVTLFPNPTIESLNFRSADKVTKVEVYTMSGQQMKNLNLNENRLDVAKLTAGNYIVKIYEASGKISSLKFTKK